MSRGAMEAANVATIAFRSDDEASVSSIEDDMSRIRSQTDTSLCNRSNAMRGEGDVREEADEKTEAEAESGD